jgi:hypothetical protein
MVSPPTGAVGLPTQGGRPAAPPAAASAPPASVPWVPSVGGLGAPPGPVGALPAVDTGWAEPPPSAGWTLPATHIDLFAPLGAPGRPPAAPAAPLPRFLGPDQFALRAAGRLGHDALTPPTGYPTGPAGVVGSGGGEADPSHPDDLEEFDDLEDGADDEFDDLDDLDDMVGRDGEPWAAYSVARAGWRKRVLRVRVRSDGAVPELVLVARPGTTPPGSLAEGQALARLAPCAHRATRTMEVRLDGALLPWGVRVLAVPDGAEPAAVDHPPDDVLVVR